MLRHITSRDQRNQGSEGCDTIQTLFAAPNRVYPPTNSQTSWYNNHIIFWFLVRFSKGHVWTCIIRLLRVSRPTEKPCQLGLKRYLSGGWIKVDSGTSESLLQFYPCLNIHINNWYIYIYIYRYTIYIHFLFFVFVVAVVSTSKLRLQRGLQSWGLKLRRDLQQAASHGTLVPCWRWPSRRNGKLHPWKLTSNPKLKVWKMIFLFKEAIFRFQPLIFKAVNS